MSNTIRFEVIVKKVWKNAQTGNMASIYGAAPGGAGWSVVDMGFTYRDNQSNTVGSYGTRFLREKTEIESHLAKMFGVKWSLIQTSR